MKELLSCLRAAIREVIHPAFVDDDPQSTAEATAARVQNKSGRRAGTTSRACRSCALGREVG